MTSLGCRQRPQDRIRNGQMGRTLSSPGPALQGSVIENDSRWLDFLPQNWQERPRTSLHISNSVIVCMGFGKPGRKVRRDKVQTESGGRTAKSPFKITADLCGRGHAGSRSERKRWLTLINCPSVRGSAKVKTYCKISGGKSARVRWRHKVTPGGGGAERTVSVELESLGRLLVMSTRCCAPVTVWSRANGAGPNPE